MIIGKRIALFNEYYYSDKNYTENPIYEKHSYPLQEFRTNNNIREDWGINKNIDQIEEISIYLSKDNDLQAFIEMANFEMNLYFIDSRLIGFVEGAYFELRKISNNKVKSIEENELIELLSLKKSDVLQKLGDNFVISYVGPEGTLEGYCYNTLGLTIGFYEDKIDFIIFKPFVSFMGVNAGMDFSTIQKVLGESKISEEWYETDDRKIFEIRYNFDKYEFWFHSFDSINGENSSFWLINK